MQTFEIFTIGNAYFLDKVFNAIKIICSGNYGMVLKLASASSIVILVLRTGLTSDFKQAIKWIAGVVVLVSLFLGTKARVVINDQLPTQSGRLQAAYIVDDVPWGLAAIAEVTSKIGKVMMEKFETAFSGVTNNSTYRQYGILFGSKVIEDASRVRVSNSDLRGFINKFYKRCMIPDLKMGHSRKNGYTLSELARSEDIGSFLKDHSSKARRIYLSGVVTKRVKKEGFLGEFLGSTEEQKSSIDGYVSCSQAAGYISDMIEHEVQSNKYKFSSSFMSQFANSKQNSQEKNKFYESVLVDTYGSFLKSSRDASEILKQNVIINSLKDSSHSVSNSYAKIATEEMTRSSMYSVSQVFQKFIPIIRSVFECLFYGVAPLVLILMVTPIGLEVLKNYAFSFVYLQMWPPMYAILYCIMDNWSRFSASGLKHNMESLPQIEAINYDISMVSGYMLALIPVLSMFVTKGLVASVGNMATSMMYIPQTAAVQTSDQSVKGNYQFGSTSMDNHSYDNLSAHKQDDNYSWMSGMKSFAMASGSMTKESTSGHKMLDMSSGLSNLGNQVNINWGQAIGKRFDESESVVQRELESSSSDYVESTASGLSKVLGYDKNFSKGSSINQSIEKHLSHSEQEASDYIKTVTDKISKSTGLSQEDALRLSVGAQVGVGWGKMGVSASANAYTNNQKRESLDMAQDTTRDSRFQNSISQLQRIGQSTTMHSSDGQTQNLLDSVRSDFNKSASANSRFSQSLEHSRALQDSKSNYENNSQNMDVSLSQKFADYGIVEFGEEKFESMLRNDPKATQTAAQKFISQELSNTNKHQFKELGSNLMQTNILSKVGDRRHENQQEVMNLSSQASFNKSLPKHYQESLFEADRNKIASKDTLSANKRSLSQTSKERSQFVQDKISDSASIAMLKRVTSKTKEDSRNE